jgi:hypothetical protein
MRAALNHHYLSELDPRQLRQRNTFVLLGPGPLRHLLTRRFDRQQAWEIDDQFLKSDSLRKHMPAVDTCVTASARNFGGRHRIMSREKTATGEQRLMVAMSLRISDRVFPDASTRKSSQKGWATRSPGRFCDRRRLEVPRAEDHPQPFRCAASPWKIANFRFISNFGSSTWRNSIAWKSSPRLRFCLGSNPSISTASIVARTMLVSIRLSVAAGGVFTPIRA